MHRDRLWFTSIDGTTNCKLFMVLVLHFFPSSYVRSRLASARLHGDVAYYRHCVLYTRRHDTRAMYMPIHDTTPYVASSLSSWFNVSRSLTVDRVPENDETEQSSGLQPRTECTMEPETYLGDHCGELRDSDAGQLDRHVDKATVTGAAI